MQATLATPLVSLIISSRQSACTCTVHIHTHTLNERLGAVHKNVRNQREGDCPVRTFFGQGGSS